MTDSRINHATLKDPSLNLESLILTGSNANIAVNPDTQILSPNEKSFEVSIPVISVPSSVHPVENQDLAEVIIGERVSKPSFNQVFKARWRNKEVYFKQQADSFISELEAVNAEFYRFIAPDYIPETKAVLVQKKGQRLYQGVISTAIPGFVPSAEDSLKDADLDVDEIDQRNLYVVLEQAEKNIRKIEQDALVITPEGAGTLAQAREDFYTDLQTEYQVSKQLFDRYRIIKGTAIGLAVSYEFLEDDTHRNNISKDGIRIDFDMSMWPILYEFKKSGVTNWAFRKPKTSASIVTKEDIHRFPNLINSRPFYWPTHQTFLTDSTVAVLKTFVPFSSTNPYPAAINLLYQKLEHNRVFKHYVHKTFLKFILGNEDIYRHLARLHLRPECTLGSSSVVEVLAHTIGLRIQQFKNQLISYNCFAEFIQVHGEHTFQEIKTQLETRNQSYEKSIQHIKTELNELAHRKSTLTEITDHLALITKDASTELPSKSGVLEALTFIDDYVHPATPETAKEQQTLDDERKLNLKLLQTNRAEIASIEAKIHQLQANYIIYKKQIIDLDYLTTSYNNIAGHIMSIGQQKEPEMAETPSIIKDAPIKTAIEESKQTSLAFFRISSYLPSLFASSETSVLKRNDFLTIKNKVLAEMNLYLNPGKVFFNGYYRTHKKLAQEIKDFCEALHSDPTDKNANLQLIMRLKDKLTTEKEKLSGSGCMFNMLNSLLSDPIWQNEPDREVFLEQGTPVSVVPLS